MIIAENITHQSYYIKGNMTGMHHKAFFAQNEAIKEKNRNTEKENQYVLALSF